MVAKKERRKKKRKMKIYKKVSEKTIVSSDAILEVGGMYDMFLEEHHGVMERIADSQYCTIISRKHPP